MIVNGNSIHGIFNYHADFTFEKNDLIISPNKVLFYVNCNEVQGKNPDEDITNQYYIPYSRLQEVTSIDQIDNDHGNSLVTASILGQYFQSLVMGIGTDGSVDVIDYNSAEIALMTDNQIHYIRQAEGQLSVEVGDEQDSFPLAGRDFLLRVYKTRNFGNSYMAIQEIVDFEEGRFFYRNAEMTETTTTPPWSAWRYVGTSSEDATELNNRFNHYKQLVDNVTSRINEIQNNLNNFYSFYEVKENSEEKGAYFYNDTDQPILSLTNTYLNEKGSIVIIFASFIKTSGEASNINIKESHYVDPFSTGTILTENFSIKISVTNSNEGFVRSDIRLVPNGGTTNLKIDKAVVSLLSSLNIKDRS